MYLASHTHSVILGGLQKIKTWYTKRKKKYLGNGKKVSKSQMLMFINGIISLALLCICKTNGVLLILISYEAFKKGNGWAS